VLEHHSKQQEAGLTREAYCRIEVLAAGESLSKVARVLLPGTPVWVEGFLAERRTSQGNRRLVIHAHALEAAN
jgi:primosomal replication protein N